MDRQSLLEQKRQRLEELRKKRSALGQASGTKDPMIETTQTIPTQTNDSSKAPINDIKVAVDAAVQADKLAAKPVIEFSEINRFSKGVQTDKFLEPEDKPFTPPISHETSEPSPLTLEVDDSFNEQDLNTQLQQSILLLHEVFASTGLNKDSESKYSIQKEIDPIHVINEVLPLPTRIPVLFDVSSQANEFIASFNSTKEEEYPGLAVVFQIVSNKIIPIYFLACLSPITQIKFDDLNNRKVIGGLKNGRIVIWEITDDSNDAFMLPTLITPTSYGNESLHRKPISSICQFPLEPNMFLTTCLDGKINFWSVNFLERPKCETIMIPNDTEDEEISAVLGNKYKKIKHALVVEDIQQSPQKLDFLNSMIIGTDTGFIHRLNNDPKTNYISSSIQSKLFGSLTIVGTNDGNTIVASTSHDCNINLFNDEKEILKLPTSYIALKVCKRPRSQFQFVSFGLFDEFSDNLISVVDFWDLNKRMRKPLCSIKINSESHPVSCAFDTIGTHLFIGFNDGKVSIFKLDNGRLQNYKVDDSIHDII